MQINLLKNIVEDISGKQSRDIVDLLIGKKDVNEFLIAKKLKLTINQTRNILYKLSDNGLVSFIRKKDKRKGWYIYFWTLNILRSFQLLEKKFSEAIEQLERQLKNRKSKRFYFCKTCDIEVSEETALLNQFTCHECGQIYSLSEDDKKLRELENSITKLKKTLESIREEKRKIEEVEEKKLERRRKKEEKEKKVKRKKQIKERKKKEVKKKIKKSVKKVKKTKKPKKVIKKKPTKKIIKKKKIKKKKERK